jgi:hypothetical protein
LKIRLDLVTNSSSSSYIIAKHKDCTREDIAKSLNTAIDDFINCDAEYCYDFEDLLDENSKEQAKELFKSKIINEINDLSPDLKLDNWDISATEGSNDGGALSCFLYSSGYIDDEKLKIRIGD